VTSPRANTDFFTEFSLKGYCWHW